MESYEPGGYTVIPPSPEVSALMQYVDFPVSRFTGQPDITLPLYTLREGSLELPITISYHGGGVKVDLQPGVVGYGWSLNAGGCISRSVRGLPDEMNEGNSTYGIHGIFALKKPERAAERQLRDTFLDRSFANIYNPAPLDPRASDHIMPYRNCSKFNEGRQDMASDIFQFSFLGKTGTFAYNPNDEKPIVSTSEAVRLKDGGLPYMGGSCHIEDDMLTRYYFDEPEQSLFYYTFLRGGESVTDSIRYNSAWHLTKIKSLTGDSIMLEYVPIGGRMLSLGCSYAETRTVTSDVGESPTIIHHTYPHTVRYFPKLLHRAMTHSTIAEFVYSTDYKHLQEIVIYRRSTPLEPVRRIVLDHEAVTLRYTEQNGLVTPVNMDGLTAVRELGTGNSAVSLYTFAYYTAPSAGDTIPRDNAVDHWGYYNGNSAQSLVYHPALGGRECNERSTELGTLHRIGYASGGFTYLEWEQNDYAYEGDIRRSGGTGYVPEIYNYKLYGKIVPLEQINQTSVATSQFDRIMTFTKPLNGFCSLTIDLSTFMTNLMNSGSGLATNNSEYYYHHTTTDLQGTAPRVDLVSPSGAVVNTWFIDSCQCSQTPPTVQLTQDGVYTVRLRYPYNWILDKYGNYNLPPQTIYNYLVLGGTENASGSHGYIAVTQTKLLPDEQPNPLWGGLRIAKIRHVPEYLGYAIERNFAYIENWGSPISSGVILENPSEFYQSLHYTCKFVPLTSAGDYTFQWTSYTTNHSESLYGTPLGESHLEYSTIYEWLTGDSAVTRYDYTSLRQHDCRDVMDCNFPTYISGGQRFGTSRRHRAGDLTDKTTYVNGTVALHQSWQYDTHENYYTPKLLDGLYPLVNVEECNIPVAGTNDIWSSDYVACRYRIIPYNKTVSKSVSEEYDPHAAPDDPHLTDTITYTYFHDSYDDRPSATFLRSEHRTNSDGSKMETFYSYMSCGDDFINLRETEVTVCQGQVVSARRYVYDSSHRLVATYSAPVGIPVSSAYQLGTYEYAASDALKAAISLPEYSYRYNEWGDLVEVAFNGEVLSSFVWGYRGSHPVAEIKGLGYEQMLALSPQGLDVPSLRERGDLTMSDLEAIRQAFPGHEVTTLTYDWLVGVGTMTDPRGVTTTFTYDGLGRLDGVKDLNGYYIRKYDYHYANQQ